VYLGKTVVPDHWLMMPLFNVMKVAGKKCRLPATRRADDRDIARLYRHQYFIELACERWVSNIGAKINMENLR
jgi:hypothetical protein